VRHHHAARGGFDRYSPLFRGVELRGVEGYINLAYHTAAVVQGWRVSHAYRGPWILTAPIVRADFYLLRQKVGLGFNAPRVGGWWHWPITAIEVGPEARMLTARLGPPEQ
jgi:hypothetical protein